MTEWVSDTSLVRAPAHKHKHKHSHALRLGGTRTIRLAGWEGTPTSPHPVSLSLTHTHTLSHSDTTSLSLIHTLSLNHTHTLSLKGAFTMRLKAVAMTEWVADNALARGPPSRTLQGYLAHKKTYPPLEPS